VISGRLVSNSFDPNILSLLFLQKFRKYIPSVLNVFVILGDLGNRVLLSFAKAHILIELNTIHLSFMQKE